MYFKAKLIEDNETGFRGYRIAEQPVDGSEPLISDFVEISAGITTKHGSDGDFDIFESDRSITPTERLILADEYLGIDTDTMIARDLISYRKSRTVYFMENDEEVSMTLDDYIKAKKDTKKILRSENKGSFL